MSDPMYVHTYSTSNGTLLHLFAARVTEYGTVRTACGRKFLPLGGRDDIPSVGYRVCKACRKVAGQ